MAHNETPLPVVHGPLKGPKAPLAVHTPCASLADVRTLLFGHSHAHAVINALFVPSGPEGAQAGPQIARRLGIAGLPARIGQVDAAEIDRVLQLANGRNLALLWRGNQHLTSFMLVGDARLDVLPRSLPTAELEAGATLLAEAVVRAHYQPSLNSLADMLTRAGALPGCRRFVLAPPPPLGDNKFISIRVRAARPKTETTMPSVASPVVRHRFWRVLHDQMRDLAAEHGAVFVPPPAEAFGAQGCLRRKFFQGDISHANVAYGALMLRELARHLEQ